MGKLAERFKGLIEKFKGLSLTKKVVSIVLVFSVIIALIYVLMVSNTTKYTTLFSGVEPTDSKTIIDYLTTQKEPYKVQGNSIQVPDADVATMRLKLAPTLTNGSKGFEILDSASPFGMTDQQWSVDYERALEGELERTLKGFPQVEGARVHLVMQEDSAFVKDTTPSSASVTLKLKTGNDLTKDQVKAIVALITGSVKNLKKENVSIVNDQMKLLTNNLYTDGGVDATAIDEATATANQLKLKTDYENRLEQKILSIVQPLAKNGNVKVKVNADMDFNSQQVDSKVVNSNGAKVSEKNTESSTINGGTGTGTSGAVDSNTNPSYPTTTTTTGNTTATSKDSTINYDNGSTETKTIVAPGKVLRLTASAVFDSGTNLSTADTAVVQNLINNAIGFDASRNDTVTVASMKWNDNSSATAAADLAAITAANQKLTQQRTLQYIGIAAACFIVLIIIRASFRKRKKINEIPGLEEGGLDVLIGEEIEPKAVEQNVSFDPIDFEPAKNKNTHLENEIRKYAKDKPEQVTDIVKAWLADEER